MQIFLILSPSAPQFFHFLSSTCSCLDDYEEHYPSAPSSNISSSQPPPQLLEGLSYKNI